MRLTWFGHSCFRIDTGASSLLIDPFLKSSPTFKASGIDFSTAIDGITHVALTHGHDDHIGDAAEICQITGAPLFAVYELAFHVKGKSDIAVQPMNTGGTVAMPDFDLTLTQALHSSSSNGTYLGNPCGIVVRPKAAADQGNVIYHMGDTDVFAGMEMINALHHPTIGIVPIGDRFTMGARSAAFACKRFFQFRAVVPCHFGTFPGMLDQDTSKFEAEMDGRPILTPAVGTPIEL